MLQIINQVPQTWRRPKKTLAKWNPFFTTTLNECSNFNFRDDPRGPERSVPENESENSDNEVGCTSCTVNKYCL